ncbi:putative uncharacterized protein DDB_G0267716 [Calliphora vicina]|uniref:putative uncharacterized protein DDB_G0267716 n=1 Tax=Calliphora vicina TaxID=7373 RepID=UPI00325B77E2
MALKIDEIMDLSLDDYIAISKKSTNNNAVTNNNNNHEKITLDGNSNDAKFGRRKGNIDDEEDDDEDDMLMVPPKEELEEDQHIEEIDTGIWKGPDSSISYLDCHDRQNDLRDKLNNSNNKNSYAKVSSVQYRMMAPNTAANRPRGIPTLLPLDVEVNNRNWGFNRNGGRRNRGNRGNRGYNNFQRGFNNGGNNFNDAVNGLGGVSNGRVQRNRKQDIESKNLRFSVGRNNNCNNNNPNGTCSPHPAQNMIIETPSNCINLIPSPPLNSSFQVPQHAAPERHSNTNNNGSQSFPIGNLTPQAEAALNLNSNGMQTPNVPGGSSNESLKSLLGFQGNVSGEMMPVFASRLMDFIQNGLQNPSVHKPVYDMKIQKDIHEIQKKPLLYKCPGGEVVSSDGAGVNCKIIPRTSGVSLNCRFA